MAVRLSRHRYAGHHFLGRVRRDKRHDHVSFTKQGLSLHGWRVSWLFVVYLVVGQAIGTALADQQTGSFGAGTRWETPWTVIEADEPGPTVLIVGGLHGNEPAGAQAAEQMRDWPVVRGKLVVLPAVNRLGLAANLRWFPEFQDDPRQRDLNRNFPTRQRADALTPLCQQIWAFLQDHPPTWVFDLQEGFDVHRVNSKSVGSSVIAFPAQAEFAAALVGAVNAVTPPRQHFSLLAKSGPVAGSLARACAEQLGAKSFILETTFKDQPLSLRSRQHRQLVSHALLEIGLIENACVDRVAPAAVAHVTRVALFDDSGANEGAVSRLLKKHPQFVVRHVGGPEMRPNVLEQFDVLLFPGGSGSLQGKAIGSGGREHVREFVREGGGVLGICAGAFLCTSHYPWSLHLINAAVFNVTVDVPGVGRRSMWYRGPATDVEIDITSSGGEILGLAGRQTVRYENGPILSPGQDAALPVFTPLAFFRSENGIYSAQKHTMVDTPAVVTAQFGDGRVLAISPHFESTPGAGGVVLRGIDYVRRQP